MPKKITWDEVGKRLYETGIDHGVLYPRNDAGQYTGGVAWNGLVSFNETPTGGEANNQYADNIKYLALMSAEDFEGTIEALTYPDEWMECDGTLEIAPGVMIGQQNRRTFGVCFRTLIGNDVVGNDYGYKLHVIFGAQASPSDRNNQTINENPEASTFSWAITTTPVDVPGYRPTATFIFDSTKIKPEKMATLQEILYGSDTTEPRLPTSTEIVEMFKEEIEETMAMRNARHAAPAAVSTRARTTR